MTVTTGVHRIGFDVDAHRRFALPDELPIEPFLHWDEAPRGAGWVPIPLLVDDPSMPEASFSSVNFASDPLVDAEGRAFLEAELGEQVEFLPCPTPDGERWLGHVLYVSDCLDDDASDWHGTPELRTGVFRYAFRAAALASLRSQLFGIRSAPGGLYGTDDFKERYEASGLTGLLFEKVFRMPDT